MKQVICKICGYEFETKHNAKGCTPECKQELTNRTYKRTLEKKRKQKYLNKEQDNLTNWK